MPLVRKIDQIKFRVTKRITERVRLRAAHDQKIASTVTISLSLGETVLESKKTHITSSNNSKVRQNKKMEWLSKNTKSSRNKLTRSDRRIVKKTAFGSTFKRDMQNPPKKIVVVPPRPPHMTIRRKQSDTQIKKTRPAWGAGNGKEHKITTMDQTLRKLVSSHALAAMRQKRELSQVSDELERTKQELAFILSQQHGGSTKITGARLNSSGISVQHSAVIKSESNPNKGNSKRKKINVDKGVKTSQSRIPINRENAKTPKSVKVVLGHRLQSWMQDIREEERTAQIALKVLMRMADEGKHERDHLNAMENSMRDCGMFSQMHVPRYIETAIDGDSRAKRAVTKLVRNISKVRIEIQQMIGLLRDNEPNDLAITSYLKRIRGAGFGRKLMQTTVEQDKENELTSTQLTIADDDSLDNASSPATGLYEVFQRRRNLLSKYEVCKQRSKSIQVIKTLASI